MIRFERHRKITLYIKGRPIELSFATLSRRIGLVNSEKLFDFLANIRLINTCMLLGVEEDLYKIADGCGEAFYFPTRPTLQHKVDLGMGYLNHLKTKYTLENFVTIQEGDLVIDCGSHVGGFSLYASRITKNRTFAIEPSPKNYKAILKNTFGTNVNAVQVALGNKNGVAILNLSSNGADDSLLEPDDGATGQSVEVNMITLADFCRENNIKKIDFLKLEAEGYEPEILEGAGNNIQINKIAIDISPERQGRTAESELEAILIGRDYVIRKVNGMLFARYSHA